MGETGSRRTRGKALLQLVGLVAVLEDEGVEVSLAPDLELDVLGLLVLLDPRGYNFVSPVSLLESPSKFDCRSFELSWSGVVVVVQHVQEASFRRQISMNWTDALAVVSTNCKNSESFGVRLKHTFLISATSRGILAVFRNG